MAVGLGVATTLAPAVAYAEGSFNSSLSAVHDGYKTRYWGDRNTDAAGTINVVNSCYSAGGTFGLGIELKKDVFGPDTSYGTVSFNACTSSSQQYNWGRKASGTYYNQLHIPSGSAVSARTYNVSY